MKQDAILSRVTHAVDTLIQTADQYQGLFPSIIDLKTNQMLMDEPAPIRGQRRGDRSHRGSNLIHDTPLLTTMYGLSSALGRPDYGAAADRYLKRFATHCTDTVTGLFPWGEHAYWDLVEDRIGNSSRYHDPDSTNPAIHDHLRMTPIGIWEKLYEYNPKCVERFAEGLDYHWKEMFHPEYSRHGWIEVKERPEIHDVCSFDFPRHSGFYMFDWAFAYLQTGRQDFRDQIVKMLKYWPPHRFADGLLPNSSRCTEKVVAFYQVHACGQTMGLAAGLFDTAKLLSEREPELASQMYEDAVGYSAGFLNAPHDLDNEIFVLGFKPGDAEQTTLMPVWGSHYGIWPVATLASLCLLTYRHTGDEKSLRWAEAAGRAYLKQPMPDGIATPANDPGLALGLLADLYDVTGEHAWLDGALDLSGKLIETYLDHDLPRGAVGIDWYESQMGPGFLLHGLARTALLAEGRGNCALGPDYTSR
jgi:hypothetical protein